MLLGIVLVFFLSVKGLGDAKEIAKDNKKGDAKTEAPAGQTGGKFDPESFAKTTCISCHGNNLEGNVGPNLHGIGKKISKDEIKNVLKNGKNGGMPAGLVPAENIDAMADWLSKLK
nr:cytochrome c [Heyndrickxia shackletonii]